MPALAACDMIAKPTRPVTRGPPAGRVAQCRPGLSCPCPRPVRAARSCSAPARSAPRSPSCSPAAASARRCRRARPSRPSGSRPSARTRPTCPRSSCRASCAWSRCPPGSRARTTSSSACRRAASPQVIGNLQASGLPARTPVISMAKGLVPPDGLAPTTLLNQAFGVDRVACLGGPAHAREMVTEGAGLVAASTNVRLAARDRRRVHARRRRLRAVQRPGRRRAVRRRQERRRAGRGRDRGAGPERRRAPPPGTSSPRSGATPSARAASRSR